MQKSSKIFMFIPLLIIGILLANSLIAQPMGQGRMGKRIAHIKKVKLLEVLELNEKDENQFLVKYSYYEKKLQANNELMITKTNKLKDYIKDAPKATKTITLTNEIVQLQTEHHNLRNKMFVAIKKLLPQDKYAIFVYFETSFKHEIMRRIMQNRNRNMRNNNPNRNPNRNFNPDF